MTNTITSDSRDEPVDPIAGSATARRSLPPIITRAAWWAAWAVVAVTAWVTLTRWAGITFPARVTVMLQALVPIVYLPLYPIAVVAAVRRRWPLAGVAAALIVVHLVAVYPALGHRALPAWAAAAPRVSVLEANVYDRNAEPAAAAAKILASGADVLVLVELDSSTLGALRAGGIDSAYPYSTVPAGRYRTDGIWSKRPLSNIHAGGGRRDMPWATVDVDGRQLLLLAVHVENAIRSRDDWVTELDGLRTRARAAAGPVAVVGDFNSDRWNPPFGRLLASGLHDAHEATGQGLSFSWPRQGLFAVPVMRLDHALVNDEVGVMSVHDVAIPGSDHVGFVAQLAVGA
jgi:endonuclease/exonuclease/phosphatase (EEP) superfamily protein YafD